MATLEDLRSSSCMRWPNDHSLDSQPALETRLQVSFPKTAEALKMQKKCGKSERLAKV